MTMKKDVMNFEKKSMIDLLNQTSKTKKKEIYSRVADILNTAKRRAVKVNLVKLEKLDLVKDGTIVVVPGKLLGTGILNKKIVIYAYSFSSSVKEKVKNIKSLKDFCKDTIDYKKTMIVK